MTSLSSFYASATTGAAGSEASVWNNVTFTGSSDYTGGKYWPVSDPSYHFYASNSALTFNAAGTTVAATDATDVICAYMASSTYKSKNTLTFEHIFARLGDVTVSAASGYTISGVSITITPKTGGTYNLRTGAGKTDGTGWSSTTNGSATAIANATPGTKANDIYLVPGTYTLTASWTATKGEYTETISNKTVDVALTGGKVNAITTTLSGNAADVVFGVTINPWGSESHAVEFPISDPPVGTFSGLKISSGPMIYNGTAPEIYSTWNYQDEEHFRLTAGSNHFSYYNLACLFENPSYDEDNDGDIDNLLDPVDGWRLPTIDEVAKWFDPTLRAGSSVNGNSNSVFCLVHLSDVSHGSVPNCNGVLLFPDSFTIEGQALTGINNINSITNLTGLQLNTYLNQGCIFIPGSGEYFSSDMGLTTDYLCLMTSSEVDIYTFYAVFVYFDIVNNYNPLPQRTGTSNCFKECSGEDYESPKGSVWLVHN